MMSTMLYHGFILIDQDYLKTKGEGFPQSFRK